MASKLPFKIENDIMIGEEELIDDSCINIGKLILDAFKSRPDFIGQVDAMTGEENTFQQMRERSVKCALWLKKMGIQRNDGIVVYTSNHLDAYIPYLATLYIGAILHVWNANEPINVRCHVKAHPKVIFADDDRASYMSTTKKHELDIASIIIVSMKEKDENVKEKEKDQQKERKGNKKKEEKNKKEGTIISLKSILNSYFSKIEIDEFSCTELKNSKDTAVILFFASSTHTMKHHVALPHAFFTAPSNQQIPIMLSDGVGLWVESLHWNISLLLTVRAILSYVKAVKINIVFKFGNIMLESDVKYFCNVIQKYKVNWIFLKNFMSKLLFIHNYHMFTKCDISPLKHIIIGGRQLSDKNYNPFIDRMVEKGVSVSRVYCLPEIGVIAYEPKKLTKEEDLNIKLISSGYVSKNVSVSILDPITETPFKLNQMGIICCKSPSLANNYLYTINANLMTITDDDGWFHTDDIGCFDSNGYIYITERRRNLIIYKNYIIPPIFIECLLKMHPAVKDACVIPIYNESDGHHPFAAVELWNLVQVTEKELIEHLASNIKEDHVHILRGGVMFTRMPYLRNRYPDRSVIRARAYNYLNNI
ncbi:Luciferin 4-monooxygenase [Camponotus japonicus]